MGVICRRRVIVPLLTLYWIVVLYCAYVLFNLPQDSNWQLRGPLIMDGSRHKSGIANTPSTAEDRQFYNPDIIYKRVSLCDGKFTLYGNLLVSQHDVILDTSKCKATATGGEDPADVIGKYKPEDEMFRYEHGAFLQSCQNGTRQSTGHVNITGEPLHLGSWLNATSFSDKDPMIRQQNVVSNTNFTIALTRYEYANLYWTIMDLYDVFLVMKFFNKTPAETTVLIMDAHPKSHLDPLWYYTFGAVHRLGELDTLVRYDHLVWAFSRHHSPLLQQSKKIPVLLQGFREMIWNRFNIATPGKSSSGRTVQCGNQTNLRIVLIWRHKYMAHPRNPGGNVPRRIQNEEEILQMAIRRFPDCTVTGVSLETLNMTQQIELIAATDVMVGMHGAAFAYSLLRPPGGVAIELLPKKFGVNWHMEYLAKWSGLKYIQWRNNDSTREHHSQGSVNVSAHKVMTLLKDAVKFICKTKKKNHEKYFINYNSDNNDNNFISEDITIIS